MSFPATNRLVEAFTVLDNLTATERERLRDCQVAFEVSLGVIYGDRLATIMVEALIDDLALDPRVFRYVNSGSTLQNIANALNAAKVPTPRNRQWAPMSVKNALDRVVTDLV